MSILVSGSSSGLGRWLRDSLDATAFDRTAAPIAAPFSEGVWERVIHTAFAARPEEGQSVATYRRSNRDLAARLLDLPHASFVFISSVDALNPSSPYGESKAEVEELVVSRAECPLIVRPASLFGPGMRPNGPLRVAAGRPEPLTLAPDSTFATTLYEDILAFIRPLAPTPHVGTYDVVCGGRFSLAQVAEVFATSPSYGGFRYQVPESDNRAAAALLPALQTSSIDRFREFAGSYLAHAFD